MYTEKVDQKVNINKLEKSVFLKEHVVRASLIFWVRRISVFLIGINDHGYLDQF